MTTIMNKTIAKVTAVALMAYSAEAAIARDGIWSESDWYDDALKMGVRNGEPYSNDAIVHHRITAPISVDGDIT